MSKPAAPMERQTGLIIASAMWLAMLTALAELALIGFQTWGLGRFVHHNGRHLLWMIPASNMLVLALPALVLAGANRGWPRRITPRLVLAVLTFLAVFGVLLLGRRRVHVAALAVVAGAVAVQGSAFAVRYATLFRSLLRRTLPPLLGLTLLAGIVVNAGSAWLEGRRLERLPAARADAPNVILLILDTVRQKSLSLDGYERRTSPELEALAGSGIAFTQAIAPSNWTPPSHASLFTGHLAVEFRRVGPERMDDRLPTLAEVLAAHGYATAGFSGNRIVNRRSGLARGHIHYEAFSNGLDQVLYTGSFGRELLRSAWYRRLSGHKDMAGRLGADDVNARLSRWLDRRATDRPFYAFLNYFDAHSPYLPPSPYDTIFGVRRRGEPALREQLSAADLSADVLRAEQAAYEGAIAFADAHIGRLIEMLRERGLLGNTIVLIASDHGEEFGEHGGTGHGHTVYSEVIQVPLVILAPGRVPAGLTIDTPVTLADLPATIADLAGLVDSPFPGGSLRQLWNGPEQGAPQPRPAVAAWAEQRAVALGRHRFIRTGDGIEELYDLATDPLEQTDLLGDPSLLPIANRARAILDGAQAGSPGGEGIGRR